MPVPVVPELVVIGGGATGVNWGVPGVVTPDVPPVPVPVVPLPTTALPAVGLPDAGDGEPALGCDGAAGTAGVVDTAALGGVEPTGATAVAGWCLVVKTNHATPSTTTPSSAMSHTLFAFR